MAGELPAGFTVDKPQGLPEGFTVDQPKTFGWKELLSPADVLASQASGMVAAPISGLAGAVGTVLPGEPGQGARFVRNVGQALSYEPRTEIGKAVSNVLAIPANFIHKEAVKAGQKAQELGAPPAASAYLQTMVEGAPAVAAQLFPLLSGPLKAGAQRTMQSAVKPYLGDLKTGKAARAIDTMLEGGYSPTRPSVEKMRAAIDDLNTEITLKIANSPATVNKMDVLKELRPALNKFKNQVTPTADAAAIRAAAEDFFNHPDLRGSNFIPVQKAQELKQGTYQILGDKSYGELKSAETEAQKALARGLKEQIAQKVPEVAPLNARESDLLNAARIAETRALLHGNKNLGGLAWLAHDPAAAVGFLADRSVPIVSLGAHGLYSLSQMLDSLGQQPFVRAGVLQQMLSEQAKQNRQQ